MPFYRLAQSLRGISTILAICLTGTVGCTPSEHKAEAGGGKYEHRSSDAVDGSGRFYMGREIARGMVEEHGMQWFERTGRATAELPDRLVQALGLKADDVVADIGAGTGYFTFRISVRVPSGKVYAEDIDPAMVDTIRERKAVLGMRNVEPVLGTDTDPHLPANKFDVVLIVASYHEFTHPYEMMRAIVRSLKRDGRVVVVEYRGEDDTLPVVPLHRMSEAQIRKEMSAVGLTWHESKDILPQQHFMIFEKPME